MVDPLDQDGSGGRIEQGEQAVVPDPELAVIRPDQGEKVAVGIAGGGLQFANDPSPDRGFEPAQIACRRLGPADRPGPQRLNRRFNSSWPTVRPARMSSRALSRPTRNAAL